MNGQQFEMGVSAVRMIAGRAKNVALEALAPVGDAFEIEYYRILLETLNESIGETRIGILRSENAGAKQELQARLEKMLSQRTQIDARIVEIGERVTARQQKRTGRED